MPTPSKISKAGREEFKEETKRLNPQFWEDHDHAVGGYISRKEVVDLMQKILLSQELAILKSVEEWAEEYDSTRGVLQSDNYQIGQNHGRQEVIRDLLTFLQEQGKLNQV
ncbi:MAG: hypothetical protein AAB706_02275 [Patescibacteria group bacterium]